MPVLLSQQSNSSITPKKWCTVPVWKHKKQIFMSKLKHSPDYMGSRRWVCLLFLSVLALDYTHISHDNIILLVHWINFEPLNMNDEAENKEIIFFIFSIPVKIEIDLELQRKSLTQVKCFFILRQNKLFWWSEQVLLSGKYWSQACSCNCKIFPSTRFQKDQN